jgi:hypothetical protein
MRHLRHLANLGLARLAQLVTFSLTLAGGAVIGLGAAGLLTSAVITAPAAIVAGAAATGTGIVGFKRSTKAVQKLVGPNNYQDGIDKRTRYPGDHIDPNEERYKKELRNADPDWAPNLDHMSPNELAPGYKHYETDIRPMNSDPSMSNFDTSWSGGNGDGGSGGDGGGGSLSATDRRTRKSGRGLGDFGI